MDPRVIHHNVLRMRKECNTPISYILRKKEYKHKVHLLLLLRDYV